jgi:hypothetical protein
MKIVTSCFDYFTQLRWFGLWCLTPQQYFSYIMAVSFIGGGNPEKTIDLSQVTTKPLTYLVQRT